MATRKTQVPAIEGWFTTGTAPHLVGARCAQCGTSYFPKGAAFCRNPFCSGGALEEVPLSRTGTVWSFTTNHYAPPPPYVAPEPFRPYTVAAVELREERMVVLGQLAPDVDPDTLAIGTEVELAVGTLYEDDEREYLVWQWRPVGAR